MEKVPTVKELREMCLTKGISEKKVLSMKKGELLMMCYEEGIGPWKDCLANEDQARKCMMLLADIYPEVVPQREVKPLAPGPAVAAIVEGKKLVGVVTEEGEVQPTDIPIAPPPPVAVLPRVVLPKDAVAKKALKKLLIDKTEKGDVADMDAVLQQIAEGKFALKKVQEAEATDKPLPPEDQMLAELRKVVKNPKLRRIDLEEVARKRKKAAIEREYADPHGRLLADIKKGKSLKKVVKCEFDMVWDPILKRCIPVVADTPSPKVQAIVRETIERELKSCEGGELCVII